MLGSTIRRAILVAAVLAMGLAGKSAPPPPSTADGKAFTACMRSHGLPDFPEVAFSPDGLINLTIKNEPVDVLSKKYGSAVKACEPLLPRNNSLPNTPNPPPAPSLPS